DGEVAEFVGIADDIDGDDAAAVDDEGEHADIAAVEHDQAGQAVDQDGTAPAVGRRGGVVPAEQQLGDEFRAAHRLPDGGHLAAAVGGEHDLVVEHAEQRAQVARAPGQREGRDDLF